jgi:hypothetical protein
MHGGCKCSLDVVGSVQQAKVRANWFSGFLIVNKAKLCWKSMMCIVSGSRNSALDRNLVFLNMYKIWVPLCFVQKVRDDLLRLFLCEIGFLLFFTEISY